MKPTFRWKNKKQHEVVIEQDYVSTLRAFRPELNFDQIKSVILDSRQYLCAYPDVHEAGSCPIEHYFTYGENEGRSFYAPKIIGKNVTSRLKNGKKVYISDVPTDNGIFLYRVMFRMVNEAESLNTPYHSKIKDIIAAIFSATEVVFIRPVNSDRNIYLLSLCRYLNVKITFDIDDLMLPEYADEKGGIRSGMADYNQMRTDLVLNSAALIRADELTCTTQKIADAYSSSVKNYRIVQNKLPKRYFIPDVKDGNNHTKALPEKLKILYLSGTKTHFKDFSLIGGVLVRLAQQYPDKFEMNFMGELKDQSLLFRSLKTSSTFIPYVNFQEMLKIISEHHLILVPLENSEFNNAKSNIKFIEAASQSVAIIASPATEFVNTIDNGKDGWLCANEQQWYDTLEYLLANPGVAIETGKNAYYKALNLYSL